MSIVKRQLGIHISITGSRRTEHDSDRRVKGAQESYKLEVGEGFGRRLREARLMVGIGTQALSTQAGVSRNLILLAEAGKGGGTAVATVALLADCLKVRRAWLAFGDLPMI